MANIGFTDGEQSVTPSNDTQYIFTAQGLQALAAATYTSTLIDSNIVSGIVAENTDNTGTSWSSGAKYITLFKGDGSKTIFPVGSEIKFKDSSGNDISTAASGTQGTGTFRVTIDGTTYEVPIKGFSGDSGEISLGGTTTVNGHLLPSKDGDNEDNEWNIGSIDDFDTETEGIQPRRWHNLYLSGDIGASTAPINNLYLSGDIGTETAPMNTLYATNLSLIGDDGVFTINSQAGYTGATQIPDNNQYSDNAIQCMGGAYFAKNLSALRVYNAVFNDYAEYRTTINLAPGHVVIDQDDGSLTCSSERLQPGAQVISDTFGHCMGQTKDATTPIAVAGRVLVYPYRPREEYHAGMAVCSAPNGTVDIMTREEIRDYPDCIIGIVSEIPQYETWGSNNVKIDGRIWVRIK